MGHGGGSFKWSVAFKCLEAGFPPDSISTDLHIGSMNAGMQDQLTPMSKFLALGESLEDVIAQSTWIPARQIKREELGHLSIGAIADVSVLRLDTGHFGFVDSFGARRDGSQRLECELTFKDGRLAWDLNGRTRGTGATCRLTIAGKASRGGMESSIAETTACRGDSAASWMPIRRRHERVPTPLMLAIVYTFTLKY